MRYVDLSKLAQPVGWLARAQAAITAVTNGGNPNDHGAVWRELKDGLANLLHDKCWYCETHVDRSDNAVDHFRPKNRVSDAANPHNGYRWLAFVPTNYRYACTYCNSRRKDVEGVTAGGKADRFPLIDETQRLYGPGPLNQEQPVLLDPCEMGDWRLLGCHQENGQPCAASSDPVGKRRAEDSIEVYHLHYEPTCKRRHGAAVQLMADVAEGKRLFELATQDVSRSPEFKIVAGRLRRSIDRDAPFSGDMHFLLRGQRSDSHPWIQELLEV
ncbi:MULTISPECIES: hypothetical protein [Pseudomonas]|uniref:hypothetical protein n=1 Tax=Pseudomonas TaxID=286 RepID=UPI000A7A401E|nr:MULTISPECIES: hypothetical protein [Pseudomonas]